VKKILAVFIFSLFATLALGQACPQGTIYAPNDSATGTTLYKLAKLNSSGNAVIMATTDTTGYAGVVVANAGTTGIACLAQSGVWPIIMDATSTLQHYVQISSSVGGDGHDTGATTLPTTGGDIVGRIQAASTGSGGTSLMMVFPPEITAAASGAVTTPGTTAVDDCVLWGNTTGTSLIDPGVSNCSVIDNTFHSGNTFYSTSYTTNSVSGTTISGLTSPTIPINSFVHFRCDGLYSSSSTSADVELGVNASQTPQSIWYQAGIANGITNTNSWKPVNSITNNTLLSGAAPTTANANYNWELNGVIQWNASTAGTFTIQAATSNTAGTITIVTSAACSIFP
jgi:hypothetical protein